MKKIVVKPTVADVIAEAAERIRIAAKESIAARGKFIFSLAGGNTPRALYQKLATDYQTQIEWSKVFIVFSDERAVPPTDEQSNFKMANETLLNHVPIPPENIHRLQGEADNLEKVANEYALMLKRLCPANDIGFPILDVCLLGMGDDGHTASLFPNSAALGQLSRVVVSHFVEKVRMNRITMTFPVLDASRTILFLVTGESKAQMLAEVLNDNNKNKIYPVQRLEPEGQLVWLLDSAAASKL
jgi:6-phosphogluconolactonase